MPVTIAGMHRSGTSMVTRLLHTCGLALGDEADLMPPQPDNPDGFWENLKFVAVNDELLNDLGGSWDHPPPTPIRPRGGDWGPQRARAEALVREFEAHEPWGWKDPRTSLTLPFWMDLLPGLRVIVCLRNPLEVALSISRRNHNSNHLGLGLWETYYRALLHAVPLDRRMVTHYGAYFERGGEEIVRILDFLEMEPLPERLEQCSRIISEGMRHHRTEGLSLTEAGVSDGVRELYASLCAEAGWDGGAEGEASRAYASAAVNGPAGRPGRIDICGAARPEGWDGEGDGVQSLNNALLDAVELRRELDERTAWVKSLQAQLVERDRTTSELQGRLQGELAERDRTISELQGRLCSGPSERKLEQLLASQRRLHRANDLLRADLRELEAMLGALAVGGREGVEPLLKRSLYRRLVARIRGVVRKALPADATVLVASKGDEGLLSLAGRRAWHFPQDREGRYPGFHPADSGSAIVQLEALRARGAGYLLIPEPMAWWLDHYEGFRRHLERHYRLLLRRAGTCTIFLLCEPPATPKARTGLEFGGLLDEFARRFDREPAVLDWDTGLGLAARAPECAVFSPPPWSGERLPYLDGTVDIVAVADDPARLPEARRVADTALAIIAPTDEAAGLLRVEWLKAPEAPPAASTSIVIPSYNGASLTEDCLAALAESLPRDHDVEIIVVDDCSTDDTRPRLARWAEQELRLRVLRNPQNSGFLVTCNNGAAAACGEILILLNNDTVPLRGWLEPLLRVFRERPDAGAVGGKLVYPDGRLQEAGGVVFNDGSAANFGKWDYEIDAPLYNYLREVDYVTGALIATRRSLFEELGGLDLRYRPIYYEETDYCFRLRERGYRVYYQPESVVIHLEGVTCGTDLNSGQKRHQAVNREKFVERWGEALRHQPDAPPRFDRATWQALAVRGRSGEGDE